MNCLDETTYLPNHLNSGITATSFTGNGSALTNLTANQIADGSVSNTEFQYINSLTSNAQTQLNDKYSLTGDNTITGTTKLDNNEHLVNFHNRVRFYNYDVSTASGIYFYGDHKGNGSQLTNLNPANIDNYIDATKIGTGIIDNTEFNFLNGVSSNLQIQMDSKVSLSTAESITGVKTFDSLITTFNSTIVANNSINANSPLNLNSWMYGRSDGTSFYDPKTAFSLSTSPVGSIIEWNSPETGVVDNTSTIITTSIPTLDRGVWMCCGSATVSRGTGTYIVDNALFLSYDTAVNGTAYNLNQGNRYHVHTGSNTQNALFPTIILNATSNGAYIRPKYFIDVNTVGTMSISFKFVFTKIA